MIEDLGSMEARDGNLAAATGYYQQARATYTKRDDILRVVLEESDAWIKLQKPKRAVELIRSVLRIIAPDLPAAALLRKVEQDVTAVVGNSKRVTDRYTNRSVISANDPALALLNELDDLAKFLRWAAVLSRSRRSPGAYCNWSDRSTETLL